MLADTDIAPEGHDYSVERDIAGVVNKAYQYLDGHLSPLLSDAAVKRILDATRAALSARATRHNQMAAINRLPPSLLITITKFIKPIQLVKMSFVCSAWYTTLVNAPTVWTDIDGSSFPGVQKRTKMVTEFLRRSQEAPVDLKLSITQARDPGIQAIVFNQLESVRRLHLVNATTDLTLGRDWMRIMQRPTRSLELLELASTCLSSSASGKRIGLPLDVFNGEAPRLRTLGLHLSVFHFNMRTRYSAFQGLENLDLGYLPARIGAFTPAMLSVLLRNYPRLLHISIRAASWYNGTSPIDPVCCNLQRLELDFYSHSTASSTSKANAVRVMSAVVQAPRLQVIVSYPGMEVINELLNREQHGIIEALAFGTYARSCAQLRHQDGREWLFYDTSSAEFPLPPRHRAEWSMNAAWISLTLLTIHEKFWAWDRQAAFPPLPNLITLKIYVLSRTCYYKLHWSPGIFQLPNNPAVVASLNCPVLQTLWLAAAPLARDSELKRPLTRIPADEVARFIRQQLEYQASRLEQLLLTDIALYETGLGLGMRQLTTVVNTIDWAERELAEVPPLHLLEYSKSKMFRYDYED